jgi:hypothetical protein
MVLLLEKKIEEREGSKQETSEHREIKEEKDKKRERR